MTIYCWLDYSYYDGLLTFSELWVRIDSPYVTRASVRWLNSEWDSCV